MPILHSVFPQEAKKMRRLMGFRKFGEDAKVTNIRVVPISDKQDATRSVVWRAPSWWAVMGAGSMVVGQRGILCELDFCEGLGPKDYHHTDVQVTASVTVRRGTRCNSSFEVYLRRTILQSEFPCSREVGIAPRQRCRLEPFDSCEF